MRIGSGLLYQVFFSIILLLAGKPLMAQDEPPFGGGLGIIKEKAVILQASDSNQGYNFQPGRAIPNFPNVNKVDYYEDKAALKYIRKLEKLDKEAPEYGEELDYYVRKFGIQNFKDSSSIGLLWKLGRFRQRNADTAEAVFYYELAQKHTRNWVAPRLAYDSLRAPTRNQWVSIDTYYRLLELRRKIDPLIPPKSTLLNMGRAINSKDADYAPYMHPSDSVLIFTSRRGLSDDLIDPFLRSSENLFFTVKNFITGKWEDAEKFSNEINSDFNEGSACLSKDGKTLYFTRCNADDGMGDCDIYRATYEAGHWVDVKILSSNVNSSAWDSQPHLSEDGNILFFSSNRRGGFGGIDLYYSEMTEHGIWTKCKNLGPVINTQGDEVSAFFHTINHTLYFGSNAQLENYGGFDIYKSRWQGVQWEEPKNVGPLVNTRVGEYYFSIDGKGNNLFYASSKKGELDPTPQDYDLYSFPMPMESRPDATTKLKGVLIDSISGYPLVGMVMIVDLDEGIEIMPKKINDRGYFEFDLKNNNRYRMYVLGENFLTIRNDIVLNGDTAFDIVTQSIEQDRPLVFESLEFGSNSYKLQGAVKPKLDYIVAFLLRYPMYKLVVEGHTDSDGRPEYNRDLSLQRARQIQAYISKEGGFEDGRIGAEGHGAERPLVPNDSYENKKKNRRVEFRLIWDDNYKGDRFLPMEDELNFEDEFLDDEYYDPDEFLREFESMDDLEGDDDWDDDLLDLDGDLDDDMDDFLMGDDDN